jgi:GT2 family glycosyltransferase
MTIDSKRSSMPPVSHTLDVAICTKDRPQELELCLASLRAQTRPADRIIVVDAGSTPPRRGDAVEVVHASPNLPGQRNLALKLLGGDFVAFFDDDVELDVRYLENVLAWLSMHGECAGVSGHIVNDVPFSAASLLYRRLFALGTADGRLKRSGDGVYLYHPHQATRVDFISGSNMVWRRSSINGLRFDERLEGYGYMEDIDFSLRAAQRGELWMVPDAHLIHHRTATGRGPRREYVRQVLSNGTYLFGKHRQTYALSRAAFARRLTGRAIVFFGIAAVHRSLEPIIGVTQALREIPRAFRAGNPGEGRPQKPGSPL